MSAPSASGLKTVFQVSGNPKPNVKTARQNRPPPLSLRLSAAERAALEKDAGGVPLGTHIKAKLFKQRVRKKAVVQDAESLARALGLLGQSELFRNLDAIRRGIEAGDLILSADQQEHIASACAAVLLMRNELIKALGLKPE